MFGPSECWFVEVVHDVWGAPSGGGWDGDKGTEVLWELSVFVNLILRAHAIMARLDCTVVIVNIYESYHSWLFIILSLVSALWHGSVATDLSEMQEFRESE